MACDELGHGCKAGTLSSRSGCFDSSVTTSGSNCVCANSWHGPDPSTSANGGTSQELAEGCQTGNAASCNSGFDGDSQVSGLSCVCDAGFIDTNSSPSGNGAVLAKASLTPAQPAAQLADHFVVTDGRLARQETQLTQLKATLPSDETAQAMQVGELEATLKKGKNLAAVHAAQVAELKSALPSDVAAQASKIVELKASGAEQQPRVAAEEANRGAGGGGVPRGRCGCCGCGSCREGQASGYAGLNWRG